MIRTLQPDPSDFFDLKLRIEPGGELVGMREFIDSYVAAPNRTLVVGPAGSGKTFMLSLLTRRLGISAANGDGAYIPLLVSAARVSFAQSFDKFFDGEISRAYDISAKIVEQILATRPILPLIDGLDEMSSRQGMYEISNWLGRESDRPVVLSVREGMHQEALRHLRVDSVVFIEPVSVSDAASYLRRLGYEGLPESRGDQGSLTHFLASNEGFRRPLTLALLSLWLRRRSSEGGDVEYEDILSPVPSEGMDDYLTVLKANTLALSKSWRSTVTDKSIESRVLDAMEPGVSYDIAQISSSSDLPPSLCNGALESLASAGLVREVKGGRGSQRFLRMAEI